MALNEEEYPEEEESYRKAAENEMIPVTNDQQLGQDILRTFARISDTDSIVYKKIRRKTPVFAKKTIQNGESKREVEYISRWEEVEWEIPIKVQPKYHELITDDISRAFLNDTDLSLARDYSSYCQMVKSFANRYGLDLSKHYNNFVDDNNYMVVSSGAYKGKRVELAKTNRIESSYRADSVQMIGQKPKQKKGIIGKLIP
jgi:hypothetical protein